jgi:6,7-dimethyl-8-ribityllumazine synthase
MSTANKNLSEYDFKSIPDGSKLHIGIVVSEWNYPITGNLLQGAMETLQKHGVRHENIKVIHVPGSYELPLGAQKLISKKDMNAVIAIGSVIQGETKHFDFVCQAVAQGIKDVNLKYDKPVIFCMLTDDTLQQAIDRSGGKHGNKGIDCALAALKMCALEI